MRLQEKQNHRIAYALFDLVCRVPLSSGNVKGLEHSVFLTLRSRKGRASNQNTDARAQDTM